MYTRLSQSESKSDVDQKDDNKRKMHLFIFCSFLYYSVLFPSGNASICFLCTQAGWNDDNRAPQTHTKLKVPVIFSTSHFVKNEYLAQTSYKRPTPCNRHKSTEKEIIRTEFRLKYILFPWKENCISSLRSKANKAKIKINTRRRIHKWVKVEAKLGTHLLNIPFW